MLETAVYFSGGYPSPPFFNVGFAFLRFGGGVLMEEITQVDTPHISPNIEMGAGGGTRVVDELI